MADPAVLTEGLLHEPEVETPQLVVREDGKPGDPSRGDVIDAVGLLDAEHPGHIADRSGAGETRSRNREDRYEVGTGDTSGV